MVIAMNALCVYVVFCLEPTVIDGLVERLWLDLSLRKRKTAAQILVLKQYSKVHAWAISILHLRR